MNKNERWALVTKLINNWWKPLKDEDGIPLALLMEAEQRLGFKLPVALTEWYLMVGRRKDLINFQDHFLPPLELELVNNNILQFCVENQGGLLWGIRLSDIDEEDPVVLVTEDDYLNYTQEVGPFSFFILNILTWATIMFCETEFKIDGVSSENTFEIIKQHFWYVGHSHAWPEYENILYCNENSIIWFSDTDITLASINEKAFQHFKAILNVEWK